ncbi:MAG TPA: hypothetical protein VFG68_15435 [Fimbriiglobus sp.]|nr:hypothetical protein [Fimbriiglobus sp.]
MSIPLRDALRMLDPEPGVYRLRFNGLYVVVMVSLAEPPEADEPHIVTTIEEKLTPPRPFHLNESDTSAK